MGWDTSAFYFMLLNCSFSTTVCCTFSHPMGREGPKWQTQLQLVCWLLVQQSSKELQSTPCVGLISSHSTSESSSCLHINVIGLFLYIANGLIQISFFTCQTKSVRTPCLGRLSLDDMSCSTSICSSQAQIICQSLEVKKHTWLKHKPDFQNSKS